MSRSERTPRRGSSIPEGGPRVTPLPLLVLPRHEAERYVPATDREVCISIRESCSAHVPLSARFCGVLAVAFADLEEHHEYLVEEDLRFGARHAREILDFLRRHRDAERVVVHCHAGISRSPAVAWALLELAGNKPTPRQLTQWQGANPTVRERLLSFGRSRRSPDE